jgi:hypothetical protein
VDKHDHPVSAGTKDRKFPNSFAFAASASDGLYLPGHQAGQNVYLIAGRISRGVSPSAALQEYLDQFEGREVHLTGEPAGPLGGEVKCWVGGGFTFCMWSDNGTYGILDYLPPTLEPDTALIRHVARVVPAFRRAVERTTP